METMAEVKGAHTAQSPKIAKVYVNSGFYIRKKKTIKETTFLAFLDQYRNQCL
jgi:hypothetical protein